MSAVRPPAFMGLVLLILSAGYCKQSVVPMDAREDTSLLQLIMDRVKHVQEKHAEDGGHLQHPTKTPDYSVESKDVPDYKSQNNDRIIEVFPRDLRQKEKFLKHLTGPLYFSPRCSKHFYRLYYTTRDCTIPAYYKRCARLLTRLAGSQRCMES